MVKRSELRIDTTAAAQPSKTTPSCLSSTTKKKFKGVRMRSWGSWVTEIRAPLQKTRIWLGSYSTAEAAARAYDAALLCLRGSSAASNLNFPAHRHTLIPNSSSPPLSPKSIQRVAAAAAASAAPPPPVTSSQSSVSSSRSSCLSPASELAADDDDLAWFDFYALQSPKCIDPLMDAAFFDLPSTLIGDHLYDDDADIRLWSFC